MSILNSQRCAAAGRRMPRRFSLPVFVSLEEGALSLKSNFSWTFVGRFVYVACQWGMLSALAKLGTPEMVGMFSLGLAVTTPIIVLSMMQLRSVQVTDARREYEFGHYLALRLGTCALAVLAIAVVIFAAGYRGEAALVIMALGLFKAVEAVSDAYQGLMQQHNRMDRVAIALIIKGPAFLLLLVTVLYVTNSVAWSIAAMIACAVAVLVWYERSNARQLLGAVQQQSIRPRWEWRRLWDLAQLALPLGVVMLLLTLEANIPRYFIESWRGLRELGFFSAMVYPEVAGTMIVTALGQAASPRLAEYYSAGRLRDFMVLLSRMTGLGVIIGVCAVFAARFFGSEILTILYHAEYARYSDVFVWLMAAAGLSFVASFLGYGMTAARLFRVQVPLFAGSAAFNALFCLLLIPARGLLGAAQALFLMSLANIAGSAVIIIWSARRVRKEFV